jgi:single-strand DNA-binding protein
MAAEMKELCRIGRNAEVRYVPDGTPVVTLSLAYNFGRKGEDGKQPTQWIEGGLWGKRAESLGPYLTQGKLVLVTFEDVHMEGYQLQDGTPRNKLAARIQDIRLLPDGQRREEGQAPAGNTAPANQRSNAAPPRRPDDEFDDDIPF